MMSAYRNALREEGSREDLLEALEKAWSRIDEERRPPDMALDMAQNLAVALYERHYKNSAPDWRVAEDMIGVLLQIDNMTSGLVPDDRIKELEARLAGVDAGTHVIVPVEPTEKMLDDDTDIIVGCCVTYADDKVELWKEMIRVAQEKGE